jgi:tetratricopeptide (TPR) repeat protein
MSRQAGARLALAFALVATAVGCAARTAGPPPAPSAPRFPDFIFPAVPDAIASATLAERHQAGWQWLQAGDVRAAERQFAAVLKESPRFYPAEAGLGYAALARKDFKASAAHFDRALAVDAKYTPALVGRGEALLALGDAAGALGSFEAAVAADPNLGALRSRIDVLRFRAVQDDIAAARKGAESGRLAESRQLYERALAASPDSPFLHRELAAVVLREGNPAAALDHARRAVQLDANEPRGHILIAEIHEAQGDYVHAAEAYAAAAALEPSEALTSKIEALKERAALAAMPAEYREIETATTVTRAQLAALLGVQLEPLLKRTRRPTSVVMTDTRTNWAAVWIHAVTRAGIMEVYPNHTFQPAAVVRRADLANAASRTLALIAAERPRIGAAWKNGRRRFPDVPPTHLSYPAVSMTVEAGVMAPTEDGSFQLPRPVTGAEAVAAVRKLRELAGTAGR